MSFCKPKGTVSFFTVLQNSDYWYPELFTCSVNNLRDISLEHHVHRLKKPISTMSFLPFTSVIRQNPNDLFPLIHKCRFAIELSCSKEALISPLKKFNTFSKPVDIRWVCILLMYVKLLTSRWLSNRTFALVHIIIGKIAKFNKSVAPKPMFSYFLIFNGFFPIIIRRIKSNIFDFHVYPPPYHKWIDNK